jgi:hypothetical protein
MGFLPQSQTKQFRDAPFPATPFAPLLRIV